MIRTTPDGRTVLDDYWVMAVAQRVEGAADWMMDLTLEPADDPFRMFILDLSTLDGTDVLAY